jgi:hypothetical protein
VKVPLQKLASFTIYNLRSSVITLDLSDKQIVLDEVYFILRFGHDGICDDGEAKRQ